MHFWGQSKFRIRLKIKTKEAGRMVTSRFIWDLSMVKKIKIKEIREYKISERSDSFIVEVYGFFGGGVEIFKGDSLEECRNFINEISEGRGKERKEE